MQVSSYSLTVRATNYHLYSDTVVAIDVLDFNDCPPRFTEDNYTVFVQVRLIFINRNVRAEIWGLLKYKTFFFNYFRNYNSWQQKRTKIRKTEDGV